MEQQTNLFAEQSPVQPVYAVSQRNKKIGLFLLIGPFVGLMTILIIYAIVAFIVGFAESGAESPSMAGNIINAILGFLGIICIVGVLVGTPLGIIYLNKKELTEGAKYDERSGKKEASVVPEEIKGWNWGAAGLTWIWGVYHGVWISLLTFVPFISLIMWIVLGIKGSEWAWKARQWESVEKFVSSQKKWKPWGVIFIVIHILFILLGALSSVLSISTDIPTE